MKNTPEGIQGYLRRSMAEPPPAGQTDATMSFNILMTLNAIAEQGPMVGLGLLYLGLTQYTNNPDEVFVEPTLGQEYKYTVLAITSTGRHEVGWFIALPEEQLSLPLVNGYRMNLDFWVSPATVKYTTELAEQAAVQRASQNKGGEVVDAQLSN